MCKLFCTTHVCESFNYHLSSTSRNTCVLPTIILSIRNIFRHDTDHFVPRRQPCRIDFIMPAYRWVNRSGGQSLPENAVNGGRDSDGCLIYVGRAFHAGDMLPAKVLPDKNVAYVSHNGEEHPKDNFDVLCQGEFAWEFCRDGEVPTDAVIAGQTADGEPLYVGRVLHSGAQTVGKVQRSHGCLYIPFDGEELSFKDYEVLVMH
nr:PREDICTED: uncharacterized protein LOC105672167 [Linepithema humile]